MTPDTGLSPRVTSRVKMRRREHKLSLELRPRERDATLTRMLTEGGSWGAEREEGTGEQGTGELGEQGGSSGGERDLVLDRELS